MGETVNATAQNNLFTPLMGEVTIPKVNRQKDRDWGFATFHPLEPDRIGVRGVKKYPIQCTQNYFNGSYYACPESLPR